MYNFNNELTNISEDEILKMFDETSQLIAKDSINQLSTTAIAAQNSNALSNNVEFWKWMSRNYSGSGIFDSCSTMQQYISQGTGKKDWMTKQLQGKGYEWDWMSAQKSNPQNIFNTYDAGDVANRAASDVTERNVLAGKSQEYQMKAYTGKTNPHLKNTPKDMTVVTNAEKVDIVKGNGYENVEEFQDKNQIKEATDKRLKQIEDGKACPSYNLKNVAGTMAKAGFIGFTVGVGTEAFLSYKAWKNGQLSGKEYIKEILKSGGDAGLTTGATSGIMIPVTAAITASGMSTWITIPIAFVVGKAVNNVIAPCFGRGKYKQILSQAKYYQNIELMYNDLINNMHYAAEQYYNFIENMTKQITVHNKLKEVNTVLDKNLKNLYESI